MQSRISSWKIFVSLSAGWGFFPSLSRSGFICHTISNDVAIILIMLVFLCVFFAWPIFCQTHLTFRPQKRDKQVAPSDCYVLLEHFSSLVSLQDFESQKRFWRHTVWRALLRIFGILVCICIHDFLHIFKHHCYFRKWGGICTKLKFIGRSDIALRCLKKFLAYRLRRLDLSPYFFSRAFLWILVGCFIFIKT